MKIGQAIRRLRHAQGRTLQQLCDDAGSGIQTGYLSRVERDEMAPSVYAAAAISRALGISLDQLIAEGEGGQEVSGIPFASRLLAPVLQWEEAAQWCVERDYTAIRAPARWLMPPMETRPGAFGLEVRDDSMQALEGLSYSRGGVILIDVDREALPDDYVLAVDTHNQAAPIFRQLASDGHDLYLRARNPQYPIRPMGENWGVLGVVMGQVIDLTHRG